jgi:hypothetical protein
MGNLHLILSVVSAFGWNTDNPRTNSPSSITPAKEKIKGVGCFDLHADLDDSTDTYGQTSFVCACVKHSPFFFVSKM